MGGAPRFHWPQSIIWSTPVTQRWFNSSTTSRHCRHWYTLSHTQRSGISTWVPMEFEEFVCRSTTSHSNIFTDTNHVSKLLVFTLTECCMNGLLQRSGQWHHCTAPLDVCPRRLYVTQTHQSSIPATCESVPECDLDSDGLLIPCRWQQAAGERVENIPGKPERHFQSLEHVSVWGAPDVSLAVHTGSRQ